MKRKKSKYRHAIINKNKYYFYTINFECAIMITQGYLYYKDKKFIKTFASYDEKEEVFSDRNIIPKGCIIKMERVEL